MEFHRVLTIQRLHQNIWMKPNLLSPRRERSLSMMEPSSIINIRSNVNSRSFHSNLFHFNNSDVNYSSTSFKWKETGDYWGVPRFFSLLIGALRSHHRSLNDSWEMRRSWGGGGILQPIIKDAKLNPGSIQDLDGVFESSAWFVCCSTDSRAVFSGLAQSSSASPVGKTASSGVNKQTKQTSLNIRDGNNKRWCLTVLGTMGVLLHS